MLRLDTLIVIIVIIPSVIDLRCIDGSCCLLERVWKHRELGCAIRSPLYRHVIMPISSIEMTVESYNGTYT
ncbi:hypothetical protein V8C40DRAFT_233131 [Trichoderma camerunense]